MAEVLDQSEVDALLAAVDSGQIDQQAAEATAPPAAKPAATKDIRVYDFKRPERVSKDQIRALEAIHEAFARNFGASLSAFLRTIIEVRVATVEQLTYSEFIHSLPNPTCFNLLSAPPLEGQMCMEISPLIIYPVIDRLLGGSNNDLFIPQRPLTGIEWRLVGKMTDRAVQNLNEAWSNLVEVEFDVPATESNPHLVQIVAPNEVVVVIGFELKMGPRAGTMSLCIPFNVVEPVMGKLAAQSWLTSKRKGASTEQLDKIQHNIAGATVELKAYLAETTIALRDLMSLQPGDLLMTEKLANDEIKILVEGRCKYAGRLGQFRNNRAVRITRQTGPDERL
jgi:flagellar motor switch protein FliM